ncbi:Glycerol kinase [compost metagenome]
MVTRTENGETTALGAALLAGLVSGIWTKEQLKHFNLAQRTFQPMMDEEKKEKLYMGWMDAVHRTMGWEQHHYN